MTIIKNFSSYFYSKEFIDKYLEWQKQDVSNLGKQSYDFLNEML